MQEVAEHFAAVLSRACTLCLKWVLTGVRVGWHLQVLCMTVPGGFGGMKMMPEVLSKVRQLRERFPAMDIQVRGQGLGLTA